MAATTNSDSVDEPMLRERILAGSQDLEDYKALAELLWESPGRENEGILILQKALDLPLSNIEKAEGQAEVGWFLYEVGQFDRAMSMAKAALAGIAEQPESPEVLMVQGISHATLANCFYPTDRSASDSETALAAQSLEQLIRRFPTWPNLAEAYRFAAAVHFLREEYARAGALYEEVLRTDPSERSRVDALVWLGNALRSQGHLTEAEARLREALDVVTADKRYLARIYYELGKVLRLANRADEALVVFGQALAAADARSVPRGYRSMIAEIQWELGNLHYDAQRYGEALAAFQGALPNLIETFPALYSDTILTLGHCCLATGQHARARDYYEEVLASEHATGDQKAAARDGLSQLPPLSPSKLH